ncbi:DUF5946 family protein [Pseudactinotalea sp. Z1732]|uniref:DUF5946 family protein n=1 Tax=Micrococcales TaxID=85006 RepID=UPI003C7ACD29
MHLRTDQAAADCPECGAAAAVPCAELFDRVLALDHSRAAPWGPLHGVVVCCYRLQHPSTFAVGQEQTMLDLLRTYRDGGPQALDRWTAGARRANSHRRSTTSSGPQPSKPAQTAPGPEVAAEHRTTRERRAGRFDVTIADVAVDGTFPAHGHADRVRAWAQATLRGWQG